LVLHCFVWFQAKQADHYRVLQSHVCNKTQLFEKIPLASKVLETLKKLLVIMFSQATCFLLLAVIIRMIGVTSLVNELALLGLGLVAGTIIGIKLAK
tara:strand:- start:245 stop:535 length:291 start_codon:yes stop_codon:yes gene_type:complete